MFSPKRYIDFSRLCLLLAGLVWSVLVAPLTAQQGTASTCWANNPNCLDTPQIMQALYNPHSDLVLLSAHRGNHAIATDISKDAGVPENSLESIGLAAQAGWEEIELDIALTSDGVPILTHDATWGREWCGIGSFSCSATSDDPFTPPGANSCNDSKNPGVANTALSDTRSFLGMTVLRDYVSLVNAQGKGCTGFLFPLLGEYPPTLADALKYIAQNRIRMVVLLDIRTQNIATAAYNVVSSMNDDAGRPFLNSVIFKMPANYLPNGYTDFLNTFGAHFDQVNFIPVFNTSQIAPTNTALTEPEDEGSDLSSVGANGFGGENGIVNWLTNMETFNNPAPLKIAAVEINLKEPEGILTQTLLPAAKINQGTSVPMTVGVYNPIGDYFTNGDTSQTPQYFRQPDGSCCITLAVALYNNPNNAGQVDPNQPYDHSDQRENLNVLLGAANDNSDPFGFRYVISDDPATMATLLKTKGRRNICYLQPVQTTGCETGVSEYAQQNQQVGSNSVIPGVVPGTGYVAPLDPSSNPVKAYYAQQPPATPFTQKIAYYDSWSVYGNSFYLKNLDTQGIASQLTTLLYSFENIDPVNLTCLAANQPAGTNPSDPTNYDGASDAYADYQMGFTSANSVDGSTDQWGQPLEGNFNQILELKAKYPNIKVLVSIGGWTYSKFFSDVAATDASRKKFVSSCIDLYINGNLPVLSTSPAGGSGAAAGVFDGFDIDWESPASADGNVGNHYSSADTANYTALLAEFRSELNALGNQHYMLTAALPAGPSNISNIQVSQIAQYLDFGDVMTYDFHGGFEASGPTNYQAPLFDSPLSPAYGTGFTVDAAITGWLNGGFPANQLLLGIPAYARGWTGVPTGTTYGLYGSVTGPSAAFQYSQQAGVADYKELEAAGELSNLYSDTSTKSSFAYDGTSFYGMETPWSIGWKTVYAHEKGLAGLFLYSLEDDDSSNTLVNATFGSSQ